MANKGWVPEGSEIIEQEDLITITPPETYIYVGYDLNENFFQTETTQRAISDISCTCNTSIVPEIALVLVRYIPN